MKGSIHSTKAHPVKIDENGISIEGATPLELNTPKQKVEKEEKSSVKKLMGPSTLKKEKTSVKEGGQKENISNLKKKLMAVRTKLLNRK